MSLSSILLRPASDDTEIASDVIKRQLIRGGCQPSPGTRPTHHKDNQPPLGATVMFSRASSTIFSPIPLIRIKSSIEVKGPCSVR